MSEKEIIIKTRRLLRNFLKSHNFSKLETYIIKELRGALTLAYSFTEEHIYEYLEAHQSELKEFINQLDDESKKYVNKFIEDINYFHTHNLLDINEKFFSQEKEIIAYLDSLKPYFHI